MSAAKLKYFIANRHTNHISYRKLSTFEERNPHMFELSHSAHETWESAHAWLIACCVTQVERARKDLAQAKRRLERARAMKKREGA